jgi:hypothetical protein
MRFLKNFVFQSSSMAVDKKTPVSHFMEEHNDNRYQSDDSPSSIVDVYNDQV